MLTSSRAIPLPKGVKQFRRREGEEIIFTTRYDDTNSWCTDSPRFCASHGSKWRASTYRTASFGMLIKMIILIAFGIYYLCNPDEDVWISPYVMLALAMIAFLAALILMGSWYDEISINRATRTISAQKFHTLGCSKTSSLPGCNWLFCNKKKRICDFDDFLAMQAIPQAIILHFTYENRGWKLHDSELLSGSEHCPEKRYGMYEHRKWIEEAAGEGPGKEFEHVDPVSDFYGAFRDAVNREMELLGHPPNKDIVSEDFFKVHVDFSGKKPKVRRQRKDAYVIKENPPLII